HRAEVDHPHHLAILRERDQPGEDLASRPAREAVVLDELSGDAPVRVNAPRHEARHLGVTRVALEDGRRVGGDGPPQAEPRRPELGWRLHASVTTTSPVPPMSSASE